MNWMRNPPLGWFGTNIKVRPAAAVKKIEYLPMKKALHLCGASSYTYTIFLYFKE